MERLCSELIRTTTRSINVGYVEQMPKSILTLQESRRVAAKWSLYIPPVLHPTVLRSAHTVYLCVLCGSENGDYFTVQH